MKSLLDQYIPNTSAFRPGSATELFALRLAQKLGDERAVRHYVDLADRYSEAQLLCAYRRVLHAKRNDDPARRFHAELESVHANGHNESPGSLVSIRVERRTIALAVFSGFHLEHADARQLSSVQDKAVASAVGFVSWTLERFPVESAVFEEIPCAEEIQRRVLHEAICEIVRNGMMSVWEIPRAAMYGAYGCPPVKSRHELRQIATAVWPVLAGTHARLFIQDASVLGLHVQTERLFIIN